MLLSEKVHSLFLNFKATLFLFLQLFDNSTYCRKHSLDTLVLTVHHVLCLLALKSNI